jgi:hypothetical protein
MNNAITLSIEAGPDTSRLVDELMSQLSDTEIDELAIERRYEKAEALATEPVTIAAVITASVPIVIAIANVLSRYLELRRQELEARKQEQQIMLLIAAHQVSKEAGADVARLTEAYGGLAKQYTNLNVTMALPSSGE